MKRFIKKIFLAAFLVGIVPIMDMQSSLTKLNDKVPTSLLKTKTCALQVELAESNDQNAKLILEGYEKTRIGALTKTSEEEVELTTVDDEFVQEVLKVARGGVLSGFLDDGISFPYVVINEEGVYPSTKYTTAGDVLKTISTDLSEETACIKTITLDELVEFDMLLRNIKPTFDQFREAVKAVNADVGDLAAARKKGSESVDLFYEEALKANKIDLNKYGEHDNIVGKFFDFIDFWYTVQTATKDEKGADLEAGVSGAQSFINLYHSDYDKELWTLQSSKGLDSMAYAFVDCYTKGNLADDTQYFDGDTGKPVVGKWYTTAGGIYDLLHFRAMSVIAGATVKIKDVFRPTIIDAIIQLLFVNPGDEGSKLYRDQINPMLLKTLNKSKAISGDNKLVLLEGVTLANDSAPKLLGLKTSTKLTALWTNVHYIPTMMLLNKGADGYVTTEPNPVFIGPEIRYLLHKKELPPVATFLVNGTVYDKADDVNKPDMAKTDIKMALISSFGTHLMLAEPAATFLIKEITSGMGNNGLQKANKAGFFWISSAVKGELAGTTHQSAVAEVDYAPYFGGEKKFTANQHFGDTIVFRLFTQGGINCWKRDVAKYEDANSAGMRENPYIGIRIRLGEDDFNTVAKEVVGTKKKGLTTHSTLSVLLCTDLGEKAVLYDTMFDNATDNQLLAVATLVEELVKRIPLTFNPDNGVYNIPGWFCNANTLLKDLGFKSYNDIPDPMPNVEATIVGGDGNDNAVVGG